MSSKKSTSGSSGKSSRKLVEVKKVRSDAPSPVRDPSRRRSPSGPGGEQENEEESEEQSEIRKPSGTAYASEGEDENSEDEDEELRQDRPQLEAEIRARTFPQFLPSDLFRYYNEVLKACPLATYVVKHVFDPALFPDDPAAPLQPLHQDRYNRLRERYKTCDNVDRSALDFFFGPLPYKTERADPIQCRSMERFLSDSFTDYQREIVLMILLADYYKQSVDADEDKTRAEEWSYSVDPIEAMVEAMAGQELPAPVTVRAKDSDFQLTVAKLDWYEDAIYEVEIKPYWPVYVAFWWVAKNNEIFKGSKGFRSGRRFGEGNILFAPPDYSQIADYWDRRIVPGNDMLKMPMVSNIRTPGVPWKSDKEMYMSQVLFCYNPFETRRHKEIIDLYDLIRPEWQKHKLLIYAMEDSITWARVDKKLILPQYHVEDMNDTAFDYVVRQPWTWRALEKLSPNSELGRRFRYLKGTHYFEEKTERDRFRVSQIRPSSFTRRKNVKDGMPKHLAEPWYPPEQKGAGSSNAPPLPSESSKALPDTTGSSSGSAPLPQTSGTPPRKGTISEESTRSKEPEPSGEKQPEKETEKEVPTQEFIRRMQADREVAAAAEAAFRDRANRDSRGGTQRETYGSREETRDYTSGSREGTRGEYSRYREEPRGRDLFSGYREDTRREYPADDYYRRREPSPQYPPEESRRRKDPSPPRKRLEALAPDDPRRKPVTASQPVPVIAPPVEMTETEQLEWYKAEFRRRQGLPETLGPNREFAVPSVGTSAERGDLKVMVTTEEGRLTGPKHGESWNKYPYRKAFEDFQDNLVAMHRENDLNYRKLHIDPIWTSELEVGFRHDYQDMGYHWSQLEHLVFFDQLRKFYLPKMISQVTGGFRSTKDVYTTKCEKRYH